jgi:hypothetical protein
MCYEQLAKFSVVILDGKMFYFECAARVRQILEVFLKEVKYQKDNTGKERKYRMKMRNK